MTQTIYIVRGSTGWYEDEAEWLVRAYVDKNKAQEHASHAAHRAAEIRSATKPGDESGIPNGANEHDLKMGMVFNDSVTYDVVEVELETSAPP